MGGSKRPALDDAAAALLSLSASPKRACTETLMTAHSEASSSVGTSNVSSKLGSPAPSELGSPARDSVDLSPATDALPAAALELYALLQEDQQQTADLAPETVASGSDEELDRCSTEYWGDVEVLTSASVLLAACGVQHALQLSDECSLSPQVCAILRSECLHVRTLDEHKFERLCHLLQLSPSVGATWRRRVESLCQQLTQYLANPLGAPRIIPTTAAAARSAFHSAVPHAVKPGVKPGGLIGQFGHQTVWCIVTMLRRIEREAGLAGGHRCISSSRADLQLASMAVSVISGSMANIA